MGVTVDEEDMVDLALLGLPKAWHSYQDSFNGREKLPGWERLWADLMQEEIRRTTRDGSSSKGADEENCALVAKAKKGKGKKTSHSGAKGKKQDMAKVKCFHCHDHGHYATNCPKKKKKNQAGRSADGEALASQFELEFSLMLGFKCAGISMVLGQRCVISYDGRSGVVLRSGGQRFGCAHRDG